jgi:hypothetical protein
MHPPRTWSEFMKLAHERPLPLAAFDEAARLERRLERARRRAHRQADDRVR